VTLLYPVAVFTGVSNKLDSQLISYKNQKD